jgi:putative transposase
MSFWRTCYHIVWTTKNRESMITPEVEPRLFAYIVDKAAELGVHVYAINGWSDRAHLVVAIPPKRSVTEVVKMLKGASPHYVNEKRQGDDRFIWQEGYGVFSLGEKQRAAAVRYVLNQKAHHQNRSENAWLERSERVDGGPADRGMGRMAAQGHLREVVADYETDDDLPF